MPQPRGQDLTSESAVYLWPDAALYIGRDVAPEMHRHSAAQCAVALDGPLLVRTDRGFETETECAVLVDANVAHSTTSPGKDIAFLYLERTLFPHWPAPAGAESADGISFTRAAPCEALRERLATVRPGKTSCEEATRLKAEILALFVPAGWERPPLDPRIAKVLAHIAAHADAHPDGDELARLAGLSPSRFQHLFAEQAGMPARRYLLWCRIRRGLEAVHGGANLTGAAHEAGFSDSAHFSRTFRAMTGISPSEVFGRSPRASITLCDD